MENINYGNYLYGLRKQNKLTQRFVAYQLNVTDKAVSKWETGKSKPDLEKLKLLASLYNVSLDELLYEEEKKEVNVSKIVLTGGPCAGKTTALTWLYNYFSTRGYSVIIISETATDLITNGVAPWTCKTNYDYQMTQMKLQKVREQIISATAMKNDKVLIICDRGTIDNRVYMKDAEFKKILKELGTTEVKERDSYDAVFHLVTAAKGKEEVYKLSKSNNKARTESIDDARKLDDALIAAWTGHPHFRIIDNSTDFEEKLERLLKEIASFLGEPEPLEIERKFLIYYPNIKELENMPNCTKVDITQTYLKSTDGEERRVRARGINGDYLYYLTEKKNISGLKRYETERRLSQDEYLRLLMEADNRFRVIHKTRYCLSYDSQYFEIDVYPEWDNQAIMEIELSSEDQGIHTPPFIEVYKEVTDDKTFKNYNMAKDMPKQLIKRRNAS